MSVRQKEQFDDETGNIERDGMRGEDSVDDGEGRGGTAGVAMTSVAEGETVAAAPARVGEDDDGDDV